MNEFGSVGYSQPVLYRAVTLFRVLELLRDHVCNSYEELDFVVKTLDFCLPQLAVMAGEVSSVDDWFGGADE